MNVVDFLNSLDAKNGLRHGLELDPFGQTLQQNVAGFLQQALGGPQHRRGDGHADQRIEPLRSRHSNSDGAHEDSDVRNCVAEIVNQQTSKI